MEGAGTVSYARSITLRSASGLALSGSRSFLHPTRPLRFSGDPQECSPQDLLHILLWSAQTTGCTWEAKEVASIEIDGCKREGTGRGVLATIDWRRPAKTHGRRDGLEAVCEHYWYAS